MSIKDRINQRKKEIFDVINDDVRKLAFTLIGKIKVRTPVDTGEARRNWEISKESDEHYVIANRLPYINVLEYGLYPNPPKGGKGKTENGYSKQAPQGFVRISIEEVKNEFK